jgi:hypothetical protein
MPGLKDPGHFQELQELEASAQGRFLAAKVQSSRKPRSRS